MVTGTVPNLFVVGAAKCGTSSLHHYLAQHPSVSMSTDKEPNILSSPDWRDHLARYADLLDPDAAVRGESSTNYSKHPAFPGVPERIAEVAPDAKIIYLVGDPLPRCVAHYAQTVSAGIETRSLNEALRDFEDPRNTYVWTGRYATQLARYLDYFELERVLVLDQADLRRDRLATIRRAFRFLGVDESFHSSRFDDVLNTKTAQRRLGRVGETLRRSRPAAVYRMLPSNWRKPVTDSTWRLLSRPVTRPELDAGLRRELEALYEDELDRLAELTGTRPLLAS